MARGAVANTAIAPKGRACLSHAAAHFFFRALPVTLFCFCMRTLHVERYPAAPAFSVLPPEPQFFNRVNAPVDVEMDGDGEMKSTTGLGWDDYRSMQCFTKAPTYRHKPTPIYATDPTSMRKLIVRFMERRSQLPGVLKGPLPGTEAERIARAKAAILADVPRLDALTTDLCRRYVKGRNNGESAEWLSRIETEIRIHDTRLRMAREAPAIFVGVLYRSHCLSENSVDVGNALGIMPCAVRQLLSRFSMTWERMKVEDATRFSTSAASGRQ